MAEGDTLDHRIEQLLNELRNTLLGVQVLLAGMVGVAFTPAFERLAGEARTAYGLAVIAAALASCFLIGPTQYHRIARRHHASESTLRYGRVCGNTGSILLGLAVVAVVYTVIHVVFGSGAASASAVAVAASVAVLWFALPLGARGRD